MLQHVMQDWLDTDDYTNRHRGVCLKVEMALRNGLLSESDNRMFYELCGIYAYGVSNTKQRAFPVEHAVEPSLIYFTALREGTMRTGAYGDNRIAFVEFVRDYAEEAWK